MDQPDDALAPAKAEMRAAEAFVERNRPGQPGRPPPPRWRRSERPADVPGDKAAPTAPFWFARVLELRHDQRQRAETSLGRPRPDPSPAPAHSSAPASSGPSRRRMTITATAPALAWSRLQGCVHHFPPSARRRAQARRASGAATDRRVGEIRAAFAVVWQLLLGRVLSLALPRRGCQALDAAIRRAAIRG